jgi:hypothetical protein
MMNRHQLERFQKEIKLTLLGSIFDSNWQVKAINQLKNSCNYLITTRGYEQWRI